MRAPQHGGPTASMSGGMGRILISRDKKSKNRKKIEPQKSGQDYHAVGSWGGWDAELAWPSG